MYSFPFVNQYGVDRSVPYWAGQGVRSLERTLMFCAFDLYKYCTDDVDFFVT